MAFTESARADIRRWLGFPATYLISRPSLENAITVVQSVADGGQRGDSSTETLILDYLNQLSTIELKIQGLYDSAIVAEVDESKVDFIRGVLSLQRIARMYVGHISDALGTRPMRDVFSSPQAVTR